MRVVDKAEPSVDSFAARRGVRVRVFRDVLSLSRFSATKQAAIEAAVALPEPPPRRITFRDDNGRMVIEMSSRAFYEWHWRRGGDPDAVRTKLSPRVRALVVERHGMTCSLCGSAIEDTGDLHIDHVKPFSRGGTDELNNLRPAHALCNIRKSNKWSELEVP